jgi:hypothetical protein
MLHANRSESKLSSVSGKSKNCVSDESNANKRPKTGVADEKCKIFFSSFILF